jgi:hypothetical protein
MKRVFTLAACMVTADDVLACPLCSRGTGLQVRSGIFGPDFAFNLVVTLLPFVIFLGLVGLVHRGFRSQKATRVKPD